MGRSAKKGSGYKVTECFGPSTINRMSIFQTLTLEIRDWKNVNIEIPNGRGPTKYIITNQKPKKYKKDGSHKENRLFVGQ